MRPPPSRKTLWRRTSLAIFLAVIAAWLLTDFYAVGVQYAVRSTAWGISLDQESLRFEKDTQSKDFSPQAWQVWWRPSQLIFLDLDNPPSRLGFFHSFSRWSWDYQSLGGREIIGIPMWFIAATALIHWGIATGRGLFPISSTDAHKKPLKRIYWWGTCLAITIVLWLATDFSALYLIRSGARTLFMTKQFDALAIFSRGAPKSTATQTVISRWYSGVMRQPSYGEVTFPPTDDVPRSILGFSAGTRSYPALDGTTIVTWRFAIPFWAIAAFFAWRLRRAIQDQRSHLHARAAFPLLDLPPQQFTANGAISPRRRAEQCG